MRNYLAARLDAITDGAKFAALFLAAVAAMFLMSACGPSQDEPAPVAHAYSKTTDGKTLVPLNLGELGDDCWFEVSQNGHAEALCPPNYGPKIPPVCMTDRLTGAGKLKCADAYAVPAYTWTNDDGSQGSDPGGKVDVPEILGDTGISDAELPFVLDGVRDGYNTYSNQKNIPV